MGRRYIKLGVILLPLFMAAVAVFVLFGCNRSSESSDKSADGYAGSESCRECHEEFYELWSPSHHGKAMQPITPEFVANDIVECPDWHDIESDQFKVEKRDGKLFFIEKAPDGSVTEYEALHAMGGKNIFYFLTPLEKGRLQTLPLSYDVNRKEWYSTTQSAMRHFDGIEDEALPWKHHQYTFNTSCHDCHVSQVDKNYDPVTDTYKTEWREPGINCEACHGPSQEHIDVCKEAEAKGLEAPEDLKIIITSTFSNEQHDATCGSCHAKMNPITGHFIPGDKFFDHFNIATLENVDYYPDGRDLGENYTYTNWMLNPCVEGGGDLNCVTCHTSSGRDRFADNPNQACAPCHQENADNIEAHSKHHGGPNSPTCVSCHMPKTEFARMHRSDHSFRPPMPAATMEFGSPNACNVCHTDKDAKWADKTIKTWTKRDYQGETIRLGRLVEQGRNGDWSNLSEMLEVIEDQNSNQVFATTLIRLVANCDDDSKWDPIYVALDKSDYPLVRSAAISTITLASFDQRVKDAIFTALADEYRVVRVAAASALAGMPLTLFTAEEKAKIMPHIEDYKRSLMVRPDDWTSFYNLGNYYSVQNMLDSALISYENSLTLFDEGMVTLVNAGYLHAVTGDMVRADQLLKKALKLEPDNIAANLNYALLKLEQNDLAEGVRLFEKVLSIDPTSAVAAFNVAVITGNSDLEKAVRLSKVASESASDNPKYVYTYAYYLYVSGKDATPVLRKLIKDMPAYYDGWSLLASIVAEKGDVDEAVKILEEAATVPEFAGQGVQVIGQRIEQLKASKKSVMMR